MSAGMRARYDLTVDSDLRVICLVDRYRNGCLPLVSDAENVIADLVRVGLDVDRYRIIYRDACGTWDGIRTRRGRFNGFICHGAKTRTEALFMAMSRRCSAELQKDAT